MNTDIEHGHEQNNSVECRVEGNLVLEAEPSPRHRQLHHLQPIRGEHCGHVTGCRAVIGHLASRNTMPVQVT